ncbi:unnamed protein product [Urochloa humidicola]
MALISVEGGELSAEQVVAQMQKLFSGKWGEFLHSSVSCQIRAATGGLLWGANVREEGVRAGTRLKFEPWLEKKESFLLPKVWIKVYGMREELREFLDLWAVGFMLGSTQTVDMETTRKSDFGRIFVAVLNLKLIPPHLDAVIGDHYFELDIEVEKKGFDENGEEVEVEWSREGAEEVSMEVDANVGDGEVHNREAKHRKSVETEKESVVHDDQGSAGDGLVVPKSLRELVQGMNEEEFNAFLKNKVGELMDSAVGKVMEEMADKVMVETEDEVPLAGGRTTLERSLAAIPKVVLPPVRSSLGLMGSTDEHTMDKA